MRAFLIFNIEDTLIYTKSIQIQVHKYTDQSRKSNLYELVKTSNVNSYCRTKEPSKKERIGKNQSSSEKRQQLNLLHVFIYVYICMYIGLFKLCMKID